MNTGARVKLLRTSKSWTQAELASRAGIKVQDLEWLESTGSTNIVVIRQLARALDCKSSWLALGNREELETPAQANAVSATSGLSSVDLGEIQHTPSLRDLVTLIAAESPSKQDLGELQRYLEIHASADLAETN